MALALVDIAHTGPQSCSDQGGQRSYSDVWRCRVNQVAGVRPLMVRQLAIASGKIPLTYPDDPYAKLTAIGCEQIAGGRYYWDVKCGWSTDQSQQATEDDPLAAKPLWSGGAIETSEFLIKDIYDELIVNTVGDLYDPIEIPVWRPDLQVVWNVPSFSYKTMMDYRKAVNSDAFLVFDPDQVRCAGITFEQNYVVNSVYPLGLTYYRLTAKFDLEEKGWKLKLPNIGFYLLHPDHPDDPKYRLRIMAPETDGETQGGSDPKIAKWVPKETPSFISEDGLSVLVGEADEPIFELEKEGYMPLPFSDFFPGLPT